jgi:hypothetical protein
VRVAQRQLDIAVAEELAEPVERPAPHHEPRRERVALDA